MPLMYGILQQKLESLFSSPPPSTEACAKLWASAIRDYSLFIAPPSTTAQAASLAIEPLLLNAFKSGNAAIGLQQSFATWAGIIASGMAPTFSGVPPVVPINFSILLGSSTSSHKEASIKFSNIIHNWVITGTAINVVSGATINWL